VSDEIKNKKFNFVTEYKHKKEEIMTPSKNLNRVMESETISKNGANQKSHTSRKNTKLGGV